MKCSIYSVVSHKTGCGAQVNYWSSFGTAGRECVYVCHDVMTSLFFLHGSTLKVNVCEVRLHLCDLFLL